MNSRASCFLVPASAHLFSGFAWHGSNYRNPSKVFKFKDHQTIEVEFAVSGPRAVQIKNR